MESLLKILLILSLIFGFFHWWPRNRRRADLVEHLTLVLGEIKSGKYAVVVNDAAGVQTIELKNSMSRHLYELHAAHESLSCNCFFADKEDSGANVTFVSRPSGGGGNRKVTFLRNNTLMGRTLYHQTGSTRKKAVHKLFDDIFEQVAILYATNPVDNRNVGFAKDS